jgi:hypothetical protein
MVAVQVIVRLLTLSEWPSINRIKTRPSAEVFTSIRKRTVPRLDPLTSAERKVDDDGARLSWKTLPGRPLPSLWKSERLAGTGTTRSGGLLIRLSQLAADLPRDLRDGQYSA